MKKYLERGFIVLAGLLIVALTGCQAMSDTVKKVSDDLGDKALQAHAFVDIWKVTPSDPSTNSAPTVKKVTVIGDIKSIPLTAKEGETVKDYAEYSYTETPAWYNSSNVTKEERFTGTGDNAKEVAAYAKKMMEKRAAEEAAKAITEKPAE